MITIFALYLDCAFYHTTLIKIRISQLIKINFSGNQYMPLSLVCFVSSESATKILSVFHSNHVRHTFPSECVSLASFPEINLCPCMVFNKYKGSRNFQSKFFPNYSIINTENSMSTSDYFLPMNNLTYFFVYLFIYFISLHVSSIKFLSSGDRIVLIHHLVWLLCVSDCLVCRLGVPSWPAYQAVTQTNHTRWCISTIRSPENENFDTRNM